MRATWALAIGLVVYAASSLGAEPIAASNWQRHPAIVEIRAIYQKTKRAEDAGRLRKVQRAFEYCQSYEDTERVLYLDVRGAVRSYHFGGGSEDSSAERALYYDREGRLRFVLIKAGAVNGTNLEHRIYLSRSGKRLWEAQDLLEGPGYTFPRRQWSQNDLVWNPKRAFSGKNPCPERK